MEGPTPVSALDPRGDDGDGRRLPGGALHAFVRDVADCSACSSPASAAFTALFAALIALTQTDLKRVLAYSTLSQLGYMFLGLGCALGNVGDMGLASFAVVAALFHLFTHAFLQGSFVPRSWQRHARYGWRHRHASF